MKKITELKNPLSENIDKMSISEILNLINQEDENISHEIKNKFSDLEIIINMVVKSFNNNGKLFYVGCGSSGRLGVLDAAECPPTFSTSNERVQGIIAGGIDALYKSVENAEDSTIEAVNLIKNKVTKNDFVLGISASGNASFVIAGLEEAKRQQAKTGLLTFNDINNTLSIDHLISIIVGPEILSGSTRMKAGTATKMILNMISTTVMIKLNKTYGNIMVDLKISNKKLLDRGIRIISEITSITYDEAAILLNKSKKNVKAAIVMQIKNISLDEAIRLLKINDGNLRKIIG